MPVFNVKVSHGTHEAVISVRTDTAELAREHINKLHGGDYLQHFKTLDADSKRPYMNRLESPYASSVLPGAPLPSAKTIVSVEPAIDDCHACGQKRPAQ